MTQIVLPKTSQTGTNEWADVEDNDVAIRAVVNGDLDNANIATGAAIAYAKLATLGTGAALIGNAGTPTATTLTGDVTVGATGVTAIGSGVIVNADINSSAGIVGTKLASATVADANIASPNNAVFKTIFEAKGGLHTDPTADTYMIGENSGNKGMQTGATASYSTSTGAPYPWVYIDDADYAVAGLTARLRVRAQVATNNTAPAITFTFGLYPITASGSADTIVLTAGTVVASSTVAIASPGANAITSGVSSEIAVPADGAYGFAVVTSGTLANNATVVVNAQLQTRNT